MPGVLSRGATVFPYIYVHRAFGIRKENDLLIRVLGFIVYDFAYYAGHRIMHTTNLGWGLHVMHHNSPDYTFMTAVRLAPDTLMVRYLICCIPWLELRSPDCASLRACEVCEFVQELFESKSSFYQLERVSLACLHAKLCHPIANSNIVFVFQVFWIFYLPLSLFVPPETFFFFYGWMYVYQFLVHTQLIHKFPRPIEYFFMTPSNHRVHHARNYPRSNFGGGFMLLLVQYSPLHILLV